MCIHSKASNRCYEMRSSVPESDKHDLASSDLFDQDTTSTDSLRIKGSGGDLRESGDDDNALRQTSGRRRRKKRQDVKARGMADPRKVHYAVADRRFIKIFTPYYIAPHPMDDRAYALSARPIVVPLAESLLAECCTIVLDEGHLHSSRNEPIVAPAGKDFSGDRGLPHCEYDHLYDDDERGNVRGYNT